jgi:hypothetical protein
VTVNLASLLPAVTPEEVQAAISVVTTVLAMAAPLVGQAQFVPVITALGALGVRIDVVIASHASKTAMAVEVDAADTAADTAEALKFPVTTP